MWYQPSKIKKLLARNQELVAYAVVGALTTLIGYGSFWLLAYPLGIEPNLSNLCSIVLAINFAYFVNKSFVFNKAYGGLKATLLELVAFIMARGLTIILELIGVYIGIEVLNQDPMLTKIVFSIIIVIANYFISKYLIFK